MKKRELDWATIIFGGVAFALSTLAALYGQPLVHDNTQAISLIVTAFSILAGFLVAIITITGDMPLMGEWTWRRTEIFRDVIRLRLERHKWLFFSYLLTLGLIFLSLLLAKSYPRVTIWLEKAYMFLATFAFLVSLRLPWILSKQQRERIDTMIETKLSKNETSEHVPDD